nr:MAG TPA: hypothetical protein [Caudoviricetes sp.]
MVLSIINVILFCCYNNNKVVILWHPSYLY